MFTHFYISFCVHEDSLYFSMLSPLTKFCSYITLPTRDRNTVIGGTSMATYDIGRQTEKQHECFLCTLDPKSPCVEAQIEGQIIAAQERVIDGAKTPVLLL